MPKMNRIRIANIQYDKKVIKDMLINCYSGENVLLNLANGGGKSVLVQLLQQPILPESKIHNREVYSYLSPDQPSYILIEWKLDNSPNNYLLTGIVMNRLFSNEDMNKCKYFTFINQYNTSNEFDIKNIPFIQKQQNAIIYKSYESALDMLNKSKSTSNLITYNRNEQSDYRNQLSEYGIFANEWKILAKMNENEGGVDELFKDCKTSDSLINKWILKTISDSNEEESKELKEMFSRLMEEIIEQEDNIKQKEILEEFKVKMQEYEKKLKELLEQLEQEQQVEIDINTIYLKLQNLSNENQGKIEQIEQKMLQNKKEREQITYEEISEEYYKTQSDYEAIKEQKEIKQEQLEGQKQKLADAIFQYRLQKIAHINEKEKSAIAKLGALELSRTNLENQNNKDDQLIKIEYNLQEEYQKRINEIENNLKQIENKNKDIKQDIKSWKEKTDINQKDIAENSTKIGILQEKISQFELQEKDIFKKMNITITRNLLNELEEKEVKKQQEGLEKHIQKIKEEIEEYQTQIKNAIRQIEELNKQEDENSKKLEELSKTYTEKTINYQEYQKQENEIKEILNFHRIKENIFQKQLYYMIINEKQLEYKLKVEELVSQIDRTKETITDLEQGALHNSREIRKVLHNAHIEYITGEDYLKGQEEKYQKELLEKNPLLPYCYIVTQEDLEEIKKLDIKEETNKLAPIITYQNIGKTMQKEKQMIQIEQVYFLSLYHKECFSTNANQYQEKLKNQLENLRKRKEESEKELQRITKHINIIEQFNYEEKDKIEMEQELVHLEREIQIKKEENINNKEQKKKLEQDNINRRTEIEEKQQTLNEKEKTQSDFLQYLEDDIRYCENRKQKENNEKEIELKKQENENIKNKIEIAQKQERENIANKNELVNRLETTRNKQIKIPKREKQETLNISLEELEAQYEQLSIKYQQDKKQIDEQIEFWSKNKKDLEKEKQKDYKDIKLEDYALIVYSEEKEDIAKEQKEEEEKQLEYKREEANKINNQCTRTETQFQAICDNLKRIGKTEPITASQIKGNYKLRISNIEKEEQEGKKKQSEYIEENKKIQKQINEIERKIDIKPMPEKLGEPKIEKENLQELISKYTMLKQRNQTEKENIYKLHLEISNNYKEKHRIISSFLGNISIQNTEKENFDTYYYIYEKMIDCLDKLTEYIGILNLSLQNIEQDKKNILQHAIKQGNMLYQEMKKISESSRIKSGDRYIQILKIDIPQELKDYVEQRIENHIKQCIQELREECRQSDNIKKTIENKVAIYLSDRQLLNLTLDVETIKVKLYKFDIENKNSGLRQWEDVIVGNSGGQKFIACFALISALIEYTRRKEIESKGEDEKVASSKVFVLDNPFGKTSSKHLLQPMIDISKKFNIQMICLSDLSQSSITDKFTLIYQLSLRSSKYTNNSFLNIEDFRVNGDVSIDTSLEQVFLRSNLEQISLFN